MPDNDEAKIPAFAQAPCSQIEELDNWRQIRGEKAQMAYDTPLRNALSGGIKGVVSGS